MIITCGIVNIIIMVGVWGLQLIQAVLFILCINNQSAFASENTISYYIHRQNHPEQLL